MSALTWLSAAEIAEALDVSKDVILKSWVPDFGMPHFKINRIIRFNPTAVDAWMVAVQQELAEPAAHPTWIGVSA